MSISRPGVGQLIVGAGGALLIVSLCLPWAGAGDASASGWELLAIADVFLLIVGLVAIAAAIFGLFRPDLSLNGATDLLGVVATILIAWLILFDFPAGASCEIGAFLALVSAIAVAGGAGDYRTLRGTPLFPPTDSQERGTA